MAIIRGAEAVVERDKDTIKKTRVKKPWRHPDIDFDLRRSRTRSEAKALEKAPVPKPALIHVDDEEMVIEMSYLDGPTLRQHLSQTNAADLGEELGEAIRRLHDAGIIHGDLTTSNMIVLDRIHLIDFGLSFFSEHVEDKATDMHLLKQVLKATHPDIPVWEHVMRGYRPDSAFKKRFAKVERRGRYKRKG